MADRGPWCAAVHGVTESRTQLKRLSNSSKSSDITLLTKVCIVKAMVFQVVRYRYDYSNVLLVDIDYIVILFAIIEKCFSYGEGESESH